MDKTLPKLGKALKESGLIRVAGALLRGTPIGGVINAVEEVSAILGEAKSDEAMAEAYRNSTPDQRVALMPLEMRSVEIESAERIAKDDNITARHTADMMSDSWLSKNIRPISLAVTLGFSLIYHAVFMAILVWGPELTPDEMSTLTEACSFLKELALWFANFYVIGRTTEKATAMGLGKKIVSIFKKSK